MRSTPTRLIVLTLAALLLGACASRHDVPVASSGDDDDAFCRASNVTVGSTEYVACRKNRDVQRSNATARSDRSHRDLSERMLNNPDRP